MTAKTRDQLQVLREFFASIEDADTEARDNEELQTRVQEGLARARADLRRVRSRHA